MTCPGAWHPPPGPSAPSQAPPEAAESAEAQHVPWAPRAQWGAGAGISAAHEDQVGSPPPRAPPGPPLSQRLLIPTETSGPSPVSHTTWWMGLGGQSRCWGLPAWEPGDSPHPSGGSHPPNSSSSVGPGIAHIHVWGVAALHGRVSEFGGGGARREGVLEECSGPWESPGVF